MKLGGWTCHWKYEALLSLATSAEFMLSLFCETGIPGPSHPSQFQDAVCGHVASKSASPPKHLSEKVSRYTFKANCCLSFHKASLETNLVTCP